MSTTTCQYCGKEFYYEYRNPWSRPRVCSSDCKRDSKILRLENKFQPEELHDLQEEVNRMNVSSGLKEDLLVKVCERTA